MPPTSHAWRVSESARSMRFSAIRRMSELIERPGIISFAPGQPSAETFPVEEFRAILGDLMAGEPSAAFQYILTRGLGELIAAVIGYARQKRIHATAAETIITEGSQQALDLVARVLVDPGDVVLVELPSYIGATSAFRAARAEMMGVDLGEGGIDVDDLRRKHRLATSRGRPVKFVYVIPSFQNPSGISHSVETRRALLAAADELDLLIVEDDPYGDLYFEDAPPSTLKSMDTKGRVIYLSSFSKILAPGLRTAFVMGPQDIVAKIEIAKQSADLCGSGLTQRLVLECLKRGLITSQKEKIRPYYRAKRDAMLAALKAEMPEEVRYTTPEGGLFVWLTLPSGMDSEALLEIAVEEGVAYVAGRSFFVDGSGKNTMRLTFAKEDVPVILEGVKRLARAIRAGAG
ncbi:MAG: PLP-dependent aminotransferase family protein [Polyangiaceae bacterium]|nr:PLP-dependent aminotransferase family protein [Polyangiaceae bacterium]